MDRRAFLKCALAFGASLSLPASVARASSKQIDAAWRDLCAKPLIFCVDEYGTLWDPAAREPERRSDLYDEIKLDLIRTPDDLVAIVQGCYPLAAMLDTQAELELQSLEDEAAADPDDARGLQSLRRAMEADPGENGVAWIRWKGREGLPQIKNAVQAWLDDAIDETDINHRPTLGQQGSALSFFRDFAYDDLDALGVEIVEGDHPGSTYFAAELHTDVEVANATAAELGFPIQFVDKTRW